MKIIVGGCLIAQMKRFDALISTQNKPSGLGGPISLKIKKRRQKMVIFEKWSFWAIFLDFFPKWDFKESWGFLRCNQCIEPLHLSYQTPPLDDFHFLAYNWFLEIFRPLVGGVKNKFSKIFKIIFLFYYGKRHLKPWAPETYPLY